jgi:glucose-1-phosphatase
MKLLKTTFPYHDQIRNIIFDFGGVICELDISRTVEKFKEFGPVKPSEIVSEVESDLRFTKLVEHFEKGDISSEEFRESIRNHYETPPTDAMIDETWNALLVGIPMERIRLLESIRSQYRIFLLSNSNEIHYQHYLQDYRIKTGLQGFQDLFEKSYFSFMIHLSKPGIEIFEFVLRDSRLDPAQTLFIDDTLKHIETARSMGIIGYHLQIRNGEQIQDLFQ